MGKLTAVRIKSAKAADGKTLRLTDGDGLQLLVKTSGTKTWVLRVMVDGESRDIGLGSWVAEPIKTPDTIPILQRKSLTLGEAREKAGILRQYAKAGLDPVAERDRERKDIPTFAKAVTLTYDGLKSGWNDKTAKAFLASLQRHAVPGLGDKKVSAIEASDIVNALATMWGTNAPTAQKVRTRIIQVLAFAKARGWRTTALPDTREMRSGLPNLPQAKHFQSMAYKDIPTFFADQWARELTYSRAAMLFALLTANRSGAVRLAKWEQIDIKGRLWRVPGEIMKKGRDHDIYLSDATIALLDRLCPDDASRKGLIFLGRGNGPLSDMSLTKVLRQAGLSDTVHGFRSSFRNWAAERMPHIPFMVGKKALSHNVGNATDQAYLTADFTAMREALSEGWGRYVAPKLSSRPNNVASIGVARAKKAV